MNFLSYRLCLCSICLQQAISSHLVLGLTKSAQHCILSHFDFCNTAPPFFLGQQVRLLGQWAEAVMPMAAVGERLMAPIQKRLLSAGQGPEVSQGQTAATQPWAQASQYQERQVGENPLGSDGSKKQMHFPGFCKDKVQALCRETCRNNMDGISHWHLNSCVDSFNPTVPKPVNPASANFATKNCSMRWFYFTFLLYRSKHWREFCKIMKIIRS